MSERIKLPTRAAGSGTTATDELLLPKPGSPPPFLALCTHSVTRRSTLSHSNSQDSSWQHLANRLCDSNPLSFPPARRMSDILPYLAFFP